MKQEKARFLPKLIEKAKSSRAVATRLFVGMVIITSGSACSMAPTPKSVPDVLLPHPTRTSTPKPLYTPLPSVTPYLHVTREGVITPNVFGIVKQKIEQPKRVSTEGKKVELEFYAHSRRGTGGIPVYRIKTYQLIDPPEFFLVVEHCVDQGPQILCQTEAYNTDPYAFHGISVGDTLKDDKLPFVRGEQYQENVIQMRYNFYDYEFTNPKDVEPQFKNPRFSFKQIEEIIKKSNPTSQTPTP